MSREIKFRAWWVQEKKMLNNVHMFYDTLGEAHNGNEYEPESSFGDLLDNDAYIVSQFTGLRDKNGKEIYEGDVVADRVYRWEVMFLRDDACFLFKTIGKVICPLPMNRSKNIEIIGNIYEHPELLNQQSGEGG